MPRRLYYRRKGAARRPMRRNGARAMPQRRRCRPSCKARACRAAACTLCRPGRSRRPSTLWGPRPRHMGLCRLQQQHLQGSMDSLHKDCRAQTCGLGLRRCRSSTLCSACAARVLSPPSSGAVLNKDTAVYDLRPRFLAACRRQLLAAHCNRDGRNCDAARPRLRPAGAPDSNLLSWIF